MPHFHSKASHCPFTKVLPTYGKGTLEVSPAKRHCVPTPGPLDTRELLPSSFLLPFGAQGISQALARHRGSAHSNAFSDG